MSLCRSTNVMTSAITSCVCMRHQRQVTPRSASLPVCVLQFVTQTAVVVQRYTQNVILYLFSCIHRPCLTGGCYRDCFAASFIPSKCKIQPLWAAHSMTILVTGLACDVHASSPSLCILFLSSPSYSQLSFFIPLTFYLAQFQSLLQLWSFVTLLFLHSVCLSVNTLHRIMTYLWNTEERVGSLPLWKNNMFVIWEEEGDIPY